MDKAAPFARPDDDASGRPSSLIETVNVIQNSKPVEVTSQCVRERLREQSPGSITKHWVEVEGVRWPVKEAMARVLGERLSFPSSSARRYFAKLGFSMGELVANHSSARGRQGSRRNQVPESFDWDAAPVLDTVSVSLSFTWKHAGEVTLDSGVCLLFPPLPDDPGLYRFDFGVDETGISRWYIGEGQSVRGRAAQYRRAKPGPDHTGTAHRMHSELVEHLSAGGEITVSVATEVALGDGSLANLGAKSGRLLAESAAVVLAQLDPRVVVLNKDKVLSR